MQDRIKFQKALQASAQVFETRFWMGLLGAKTCKPTVMMGNMDTIAGLDKGKLSKKQRHKKLAVKTSSPLITLVRSPLIPMRTEAGRIRNPGSDTHPSIASGKYVDDRGVRRWAGLPVLKSTQHLSMNIRARG